MTEIHTTYRKRTQKIFLLIFVSCTCTNFLFSQLASQTILTIEDIGIPYEEYLHFLDLYDPNRDHSGEFNNTKFIDYHLKLYEARQIGCDTTQAYLTERAQFRDNLARYFLDYDRFDENRIEDYYRRTLKDLEISHMLITITGDVFSDTLLAYKQIDSLRQQLLEGADFNTLAYQYSDAKSAKDSGYMAYVSAMQMNYPLEELAYRTPVGSVSEILRTSTAYHLLMVHSEKATEGSVKSLELLNRGTPIPEKAKEKISQFYQNNSSRQNYLRDRFLRSVMRKYGFYYDKDAYEQFVKYGENSFQEGEWIEPKNLINGKVLFTIGEQDITYSDFSQYLYKQKFAYSFRNYPLVVTKHFQDFFFHMILAYQNKHLESRYPEFNFQVEEYSDALLINCIEDRYWSASTNKESELKKYYNKHNQKYEVNGYEGLIIRFKDVQTKKKLEFKINHSKLKPNELETEILNKYPSIVSFESVLVKKGENRIVDYFIWGKSRFKSEYTLMMVSGNFTKLPAESFNEVVTDVIIDYYKATENKRNLELRKKYKYKFHRKLLRKMKKATC